MYFLDDFTSTQVSDDVDIRIIICKPTNQPADQPNDES